MEVITLMQGNKTAELLDNDSWDLFFFLMNLWCFVGQLSASCNSLLSQAAPMVKSQDTSTKAAHKDFYV